MPVVLFILDRRVGFLHLFGLLWTTDLDGGLDTINRYLPFMLFGFLWLAAKYENRDLYMYSFVFGLFFCSLLAHYNLLQQIYPDNLIEGVVSGKRNGEE